MYVPLEVKLDLGGVGGLGIGDGACQNFTGFGAPLSIEKFFGWVVGDDTVKMTSALCLSPDSLIFPWTWIGSRSGLELDNNHLFTIC